MSKSRCSSTASTMASESGAGQDEGVAAICRRKQHAEQLFEASLRKLRQAKPCSRRQSQSSSTIMSKLDIELMQLLTSSTHQLHVSDGADVIRDAAPSKDLVTSCSVQSPDKEQLADLCATLTVFSSDRLDEYLAQDRMEASPADRTHSQTDVIERLDHCSRKTRQPEDMIPSRPASDDDLLDSLLGAGGSEDGWTSDMEMDIVDGFSIYSFSTADSLLKHMDDTDYRHSEDVPEAANGTKKLQQPGGSVAKLYLSKTKSSGWRKRVTEYADALETLLSDGVIRDLSDNDVLAGLDLTQPPEDEATTCRRTGVGRLVQRRGVGKLGDDERQPRKGRIYGRKFDGRFASKANIHYHHIKRRRRSSPSTDIVSQTSRQSDSWTTHQKCIKLASSANLQPRVDLTKAVVPVKPVETKCKESDNGPSCKAKSHSKCKATAAAVTAAAVKSSERLHLIRLTESTARRAIVALQLAPSMMNSPIKCNKPGCSHGSGVSACQYSSGEPAAPYDSASPCPPLPAPIDGVICTQAFCRLGCVCDSIHRSTSPTSDSVRPRDHCGHPDCMLDTGTCTYRTRLRSGRRMSLFDRDTAPGDDDDSPLLPSSTDVDRDVIPPSSVVQRDAAVARAVGPPPPRALKLRRLHRELMRLHVRSEQRAMVGDYSVERGRLDDDGHVVRKSGRIKERDQLSFSGFEKMKPLFLYDASFMLRDDDGTQSVRRRRRGEKAELQSAMRYPFRESAESESFVARRSFGSYQLDQPIEKPYVNIEIDDDNAYNARHAADDDDDGDGGLMLPDSCARTAVYAPRLKSLEHAAVDDGSNTAYMSEVQSRTVLPKSTLSETISLHSLTSHLPGSGCQVNSNKLSGMTFMSKPRVQFSNPGGRRNISWLLKREAPKVECNTKPESLMSKSSTAETPSPRIAAVEGGFHTQNLLFMKNEKMSAFAAAKSAFLLKIQSNCCWDSIRHRILEMITRQCADNTGYPPLEKLHIDGFLVEILPKADRAEILPADVQKKVMSRSLCPICIRITIDRTEHNRAFYASSATGLSAFTKLKLMMPTEQCNRDKSCKSSKETAEKSLPQVLTSSFSFGPFAGNTRKTVISPSTAIGTCSPTCTATASSGSLPVTQSTEPFTVIRKKPAILSCVGSNGSTCGAKLNVNACNSLSQRKFEHSQLSDRTIDSRQLALVSASEGNVDNNVTHNIPSTVLILPSSDRNLSVSCRKSAVHTSKNESVQLSTLSSSLSAVRQDCHQTTVDPSAEVIIVDEDDSNVFSGDVSMTDIETSVLPCESKSGLSTALPHASILQPSLVHSSNSDTTALQSVYKLSAPDSLSAISEHICDMKPESSVEVMVTEGDEVVAVGNCSTASQLIETVASSQVYSTLFSVSMQGSVVHSSASESYSLAATQNVTVPVEGRMSAGDNQEQCTNPVCVTNLVSSSSTSGRSVLMKNTTDISSEHEPNAAEAEHGKESERVQHLPSTMTSLSSCTVTEDDSGKFQTDDEASAVDLLHMSHSSNNENASTDCLACHEELSADTESCLLSEQNSVNTSHRIVDAQHLPVVSTRTAEQHVSAPAAAGHGQLLVDGVESCSSTAAAANTAAASDDVVEIVASDEEHSSDSDIDVIDVTSCDYNSSICDDGVCGQKTANSVTDAPTPDCDNSGDAKRQLSSEVDQLKRTVRKGRRKQLLAERPADTEFSEQSLLLRKERLQAKTRAPSPTMTDSMLNDRVAKERDRRSTMQLDFHCLRRLLCLTGFLQATLHPSRQFLLDCATHAVKSLKQEHSQLLEERRQLQQHGRGSQRSPGVKTEPLAVVNDVREMSSSMMQQSTVASRKRKYRSAVSVLRRQNRSLPSPAASSAANIDTTVMDTAVAADTSATVAVDVVASMHSYAMPRHYQQMKCTPRFRRVRVASEAVCSKTSHTEVSDVAGVGLCSTTDLGTNAKVVSAETGSEDCSADASSPGSSKSVPSGTSNKKTDEVVKTGRLVVSGQLLAMLSKSQRPRSTASLSSNTEKMRIAPRPWKFHSISLADYHAAGKRQPTTSVPKLQIEAGTDAAGTVGDCVEQVCCNDDETATLESTHVVSEIANSPKNSTDTASTDW